MTHKFYLLLLLVVVTGCSSTREYLGIDRESPNEYESVNHESLEIPDTCVLRDPKPGMKRPQQRSTPQKTKQIFIQTGQKDKAKSTSDSEKILLKQVGADKNQDNIRELIDRESHHEPTLREKIQKTILFWKKPKKGKVINPEKEKGKDENNKIKNRDDDEN